GRLFLPRDHYHVSGDRIERLADQRYRLEGAVLTTCDWDEAKGERPVWRLRARRLTIEPERYLTARDVMFDINNVPVFYLPYLIWPVKTERQSGLLQPHLGYSTSEGLKVRQPIFVTLGPSQDLTLTLDERTRRGEGGLLEYRYRFSRRSRGQIEVEVFRDRVTDVLRRRAATVQVVEFNERLQLRVSGQYVSDESILRDLHTATEDRTRRTIESNLFLTYHDAYQAMTVLTRYTRDLTAAGDASAQLLPALAYRLPSARLWSAPLFVSTEASAINFWRRDGPSVQRVDIFPVLVWRQETPLGLIVTPRVGIRETAYWREDSEGGAVRRDLRVAGLGLAGAARRTWDRAGRGPIIHAVEPGILYTYVGARDGEAVPRFDEIDDIPEQSLITATLTNRLIAQSGSAQAGVADHELLWVRLTQSYRLAHRPDGIPWSALRAEATVRTHSMLQFDADAFFDHAERTVTVFNSDTRLTWAPYWDLALGHRSTRPRGVIPLRGDVLDPLSLGLQAAEPREEIDYYTVGAHAYLPRGFVLANKTYYNRRTHAYTEISYGLKYTGQCWSVAFTYQDFPEKNQFGVLLTLIGATSAASGQAADLFSGVP
ncbi:MAG: LPS assembly protein LptD, partial [Nitrospiria bacterium]